MATLLLEGEVEEIMDQDSESTGRESEGTEAGVRRDWEQSEWFRRWLELIRANPGRR